MSNIATKLFAIAKIGQENKQSSFNLKNLFPFKHYYDKDENLIKEELDEIDGLWTRREILARYLLLQAVLDQGPDIVGIRKLLHKTTDSLYKEEIRFLHSPIEFFEKIGISIDSISEHHEAIKSIRSNDWARNNNSKPSKYNLYMENSTQILGYSIYRWAYPLYCHIY